MRTKGNYINGVWKQSKGEIFFYYIWIKSNWTDDVYILASPNAEVGKSTTNRRDSKSIDKY